MTVRRIDPETGDIFTSGQQFLNGQNEIAQTIITRLKLFLGEYFRDITIGTPWFELILVKGNTLEQRDNAIKRIITQTEGVQSLVKYETDYDIDARKYIITGTVLTIFGEVEFSGGN